MMLPETPVLVIGAGPVGLFLTLRLCQIGVPVIVLEKDTVLQTVPRALGYFGQASLALQRAGLWESMHASGPTFGNLCWRKIAKANADGSKSWGDEIAHWKLSAGTSYKKGEPGWGMLVVGQHKFRDILLREIARTGLAEIHWGYALKNISQDDTSVTVVITTNTGLEKTLAAQFCVACDGGKSTTRKQLGIELQGYTWPETIISSDVLLNLKLERTEPQYIIDPVNWGFFCPLEYDNPSGPTAWRVNFPVNDQELQSENFEMIVKEKFEAVLPGPRPLKYEIIRQQPYRTHQRLATTMHVGRICLAGDAAHLNAPWGALGLTTGILDAEALADTLEMILREGKPLSLLEKWSEVRRKAFASVSNPISTSNKKRCSDLNPDRALEDDWLLRAVAENDEEKLASIADAFKGWRVDMRDFVSA